MPGLVASRLLAIRLRQVKGLKPSRAPMMTVTAAFMGLLPILWSTSAGADVMRRIAAPMIGGMVTATVLTLVILPSLYLIVNGWNLRRA